jgi:membrane protease YdiL (CAAX protease family)
LTHPVDGPASEDPGAGSGPAADGATADVAGTDGAALPVPAAPETTRPGLRTFSLDGRRTPGLYLVGWLATALGGPLLGVAIVSGARGFGGLFLIVVGSLLLGLGLTAAAGAQGIERRDRADLAYRGPSPFLVFGASIPLTILIELPFQVVGFDFSSPFGTLVVVVLIGAVWLTLLGLTVVGTGTLRWSEIAIGVLATPATRIAGDALVGAATAIPIILATAIVAAILVSITGVTPEGPIVAPTDASALILGLLAAAVVAPISEELFYRGFATTAWMRSLGPGRAIIRGGLFFAFVHVLTLSGTDFDHATRAALVTFGARIPVALALGWIFVSRRSLAASIGLHATFNGILVVLSAVAVGASPS